MSNAGDQRMLDQFFPHKVSRNGLVRELQELVWIVSIFLGVVPLIWYGIVIQHWAPILAGSFVGVVGLIALDLWANRIEV